jgi:hypothetical protein
LLLTGGQFEQKGVGSGDVSAWMVHMAVAVDSFGDGLMTRYGRGGIGLGCCSVSASS